MRTVTKNVRKAIGIIMAITFVVASLVIPSTTVQAKTKKAAAVASPSSVLILNDGTLVPWSKGVVVPCSKLIGSYYVMTNATPGMSYSYAQFISWGDYFIEDDPEPNWAYEGILTESGNAVVRAQFAEAAAPDPTDGTVWFKMVPPSTPILSMVVADSFNDPYYDTVCIFYQEVDKNGNETANHWSFNYTVDKTK
ncbi:MAG: hypothetical protein KBH85_10275 [Lachnospiraceae bacterium]|nr:hypothetical protein [Lachnospiraceae bacterium]